MKILQINKYFYRKGGAETVFFNTIHLLESHGHQVIPFCLKNERNLPSPYSSYFVDYPELSESTISSKLKHLPSFIYNQEAAERLDKLIRHEKPDIAHIHLMFNSLSVSILPVLKRHGIPVVMSVHDYRLVCPAYTFTDGQGNFCERCQGGHFYRCLLHACSKGNRIHSLMLCMDSYFRALFYPPTKFVSQFIFVSQFSLDKHIQIDERFVDKCTYLYNFTPPTPEPVPARGDYLLFFGRISGEKGIPTLLEAIGELPGIQLKLAGTGPLLERLKEQAPPNAEFVGFKQGEELRELIRGASFVVVPSECYENNPLTIIESYMLGTPVIGSALGGIPELIREGQTGYSFKPKSANALRERILQAHSIPAEAYSRMSGAARRFALENFSAEHHYERLMAIYQSLLNDTTR